jgi:TatA/E family protein of Tat protein translocase
MFGIGGGELFVIVLVVLLVFGPSKIPELARAFGAAYREFMRVRRNLDHTLSELRQEIDLNLDVDGAAPPLQPPAGSRISRPAPSSLIAPRETLPVPEADDYLTAAADKTVGGASAAPSDPSDYLGAQQ